MKLIKILKYLNKKFPEKTMAPWDKSGLQIFDQNLQINPQQTIHKILVALDLTNAALEQALAQKVDLIITRHPFIFFDLKSEKNNPQKNLMIKQLLAHNILVYSIHTNYDVSPNNRLISLIEDKMEMKKSYHFGEDNEGTFFSLRQPINPSQFYKTWAELVPNATLHQSRNWLKHPIKEFYFVSGSGGDSMINSQLKNATFVTGELKWQHWIYALDNEVQVLTLGHDMENDFVTQLKKLLENAYPEIMVIPWIPRAPFFSTTTEV